MGYGAILTLDGGDSNETCKRGDGVSSKIIISNIKQSQCPHSIRCTRHVRIRIVIAIVSLCLDEGLQLSFAHRLRIRRVRARVRARVRVRGGPRGNGLEEQCNEVRAKLARVERKHFERKSMQRWKKQVKVVACAVLVVGVAIAPMSFSLMSSSASASDAVLSELNSARALRRDREPLRLIAVKRWLN
jgi:hypothetical protein